MKPYYKDPLAAAWMGLHHGIRYEPGASGKGDVLFVNVRQLYENSAERERILSGSRWYIHAASLHLLSPREGDLVRRSDNPACHYCGMAHYDEVESDSEIPVARIIQRNGIPFHWPEFSTDL